MRYSPSMLPLDAPCPVCHGGHRGVDWCPACAMTGLAMSPEVAAFVLKQAATIQRLTLELARRPPTTVVGDGTHVGVRVPDPRVLSTE